MELHLELNKEKQVTKVWGCVSSGCIHFEEDESNVYASIDAGIDDKGKDGLRIEKTVYVRKREEHLKFIRDIFNDNLPTVGGTPKADEDELVEAYKFVVERASKMQYVGVKVEFTSARGINVYYHVKHEREQDGANIVVVLTAEKGGERLVYRCTGHTANSRAVIEEAAKAIGTYILFSNYVAQQAAEGGAQQSA
jgi:ribosome-associated translation inhibitor RaiA